MNANMAALDMVRKPKVEIEEVMYPEELEASMPQDHPDAAQDMALMQQMEGAQGELPPPPPGVEDPRMMKKPMMPMR